MKLWKQTELERLDGQAAETYTFVLKVFQYRLLLAYGNPVCLEVDLQFLAMHKTSALLVRAEYHPCLLASEGLEQRAGEARAC